MLVSLASRTDTAVRGALYSVQVPGTQYGGDSPQDRARGAFVGAALGLGTPYDGAQYFSGSLEGAVKSPPSFSRHTAAHSVPARQPGSHWPRPAARTALR